MERIKQAVERARRLGSAAPVSAVHTEDIEAHPVHQSNVQYTQTKVIRLDESHLAKNRIMIGSSDSQSGAAYSLLRTQVLHKMKEMGWCSLAVTSPGRGEGKTTTALNLAICLAREVNHTVLLVDLDLRNPSVHCKLGFDPKAGLGEYLYGETSLPGILVNPGTERLVVLPCRAPLANSSEVLSSPKMVGLVEELKSRYPARIVIFDLPPLLTADDPLVFSPYVDAFLLVLEEGKTRKDDLARAAEILGDSPIIGTIINKTVPAKGHG